MLSKQQLTKVSQIAHHLCSLFRVLTFPSTILPYLKEFLRVRIPSASHSHSLNTFAIYSNTILQFLNNFAKVRINNSVEKKQKQQQQMVKVGNDQSAEQSKTEQNQQREKPLEKFK